MSAVRFEPWVGGHYANDGFRGLRVLVVSESHYGSSKYERRDVTPEIVKALALGLTHPHTQGKFGRHPHYAKIPIGLDASSPALQLVTPPSVMNEISAGYTVQMHSSSVAQNSTAGDA
jgi:hypothetical protein